MASTLMRSKDGRLLCGPHRRTGAPAFHTEGCAECEAARARGVQRPDATTAPAKMRGRGALHQRFVDWNKVRAARRARGEQ